MIEIRDLRKRFGATAALDGVSTTIAGGEFAALLGANGAGKTTLLRCMLGLLAFDGTIRIGGRDVIRDGRAARRLAGYVPQRPAFPPELTCGEVMDLFGRLRGLRDGDAAWLERVGLDAQATTPVHALSGGMRQRLALAVALQADPPVILFDEPAAHLDVAARRALHRDLRTLAVQGRTVVLSTHLAAESLKPATRALVLERGRLIYDGPPQGLGAAVQQRIVFTLNGNGREEMVALLAAVAEAGIRPLAVHVEEPSVDSRALAVGAPRGQEDRP